MQWDLEGYEQLINSSFTWWTIIRMFKTGCLSHGLNIRVPKQFKGKGMDVGNVVKPTSAAPLSQQMKSGLDESATTPDPEEKRSTQVSEHTRLPAES